MYEATKKKSDNWKSKEYSFNKYGTLFSLDTNTASFMRLKDLRYPPFRSATVSRRYESRNGSETTSVGQ